MFYNTVNCLLSYFLNSFMILDDAVDNNKVIFTESLQLMQRVTGIGGGLWAVWGFIVLAGGLKDKNGPALQSGIWQIAGGGIIILAAALFNKVGKI